MIYDDIYGQFEEHVKTGDTVWCAGDIVDGTKKIVVGPNRHDSGGFCRHSYEAVNSAWNEVYFDNYEDADRVRREFCRGYTDWIFGIDRI